MKPLIVNNCDYQPKYISIPVETISEELPSKRLGRDPFPFLLGNNSITPVPHKPAGSYKRREDPTPVPVGCPVPLLSPVQLGSNTYQQSTERISAIVQPNISSVKTGFLEYGVVFGKNENPSNDGCGKITSKIMCSVDSSHFSYYKHTRCNDPGCPVCYPKFVKRISDAAVERVRGYRSVYGKNPLYHLIFWPDIGTGYKGLKSAFRDAQMMIRRLGVKAAVVWYHPYRIQNEIKQALRRYKIINSLDSSIGFWQLAHDDVLGLGGLAEYVVYGPHFHAIATGYLMPSKEYAKLKIGGYKKRRVLSHGDDVKKTAYYITSHACYEAKKSTVRYFGDMSYSKLARDDGEERIEDIVCEKCGKSLSEYYCDDNEVVTGLKHKCLTQKVIIYKYWKRGDKPQGVRKTRATMIWGEDGPPSCEDDYL